MSLVGRKLSDIGEHYQGKVQNENLGLYRITIDGHITRVKLSRSQLEGIATGALISGYDELIVERDDDLIFRCDLYQLAANHLVEEGLDQVLPYQLILPEAIIQFGDDYDFLYGLMMIASLLGFVWKDVPITLTVDGTL